MVSIYYIFNYFFFIEVVFTFYSAHLVSGIFRKSGSHEVIEKLKAMYDSPTGKILLQTKSIR